MSSGGRGSHTPAQWLAFLPGLPRFEEENQRLLELNQRCQFASCATMQWLDIRLQLMGAAVVSAIAGIALVQHQQGLANPGAILRPITLTLGASHSMSLFQTPLHVSLTPTSPHHYLLPSVPCEDASSIPPSLSFYC